MATGYGHVHGKLERSLEIHESYGWSAGNIVSPMSDFGKWNAALTGGKIVPPSEYTLMSISQSASSGRATAYGLGLFICRMNGQPRIGHVCGTFGFMAANFYFVQQKVRAIALTSNADVPETGEMPTTAFFKDLFPEFGRAAMQSAADEYSAVTAKAKAGFDHLKREPRMHRCLSGAWIPR